MPAKLAVGTPAQERELRPQGRRTMQRLLEAGRYVFEARGFHAARIDDICKRAKTSHGTFYLYFANKEDLFRALAGEAMADMQALPSQLGSISPDAGGRVLLRDWVAKYVDAYAQHGTVIRAWTEGQFADKELGRRGTSLLLDMADVLGKRIAEVRGVAGDASLAGVTCLAMLERFNYLRISHQVKFSREDAVDELTRAMFEGFFLPR